MTYSKEYQRESKERYILIEVAIRSKNKIFNTFIDYLSLVLCCFDYVECPSFSPYVKSMEDIYLFGGISKNEDGTVATSNEIHKLSIGESDAVN